MCDRQTKSNGRMQHTFFPQPDEIIRGQLNECTRRKQFALFAGCPIFRGANVYLWISWDGRWI